MDARLWDPSAAAAVSRRRRILFAAGAAMSVLAIGILVALLFGSPPTFGRALGLATEVPAQITDVRLADEQSTRDDTDPRWIVTLEWVDPDDGVRRDTRSTVNAVSGAYSVGQQDSVFVWLGDDVAYDDGNPPGIWWGLGGVVVLLALAVRTIRQAAPWKTLLDSLSSTTPLRVRVTAFTTSINTQRPLVDCTPVDGGGPGAVLRLFPQPPFVYPRVGEELELHPLRDDRRGPLLFRRPADDVWWCALYRPGLEPVDP